MGGGTFGRNSPVDPERDSQPSALDLEAVPAILKRGVASTLGEDAAPPLASPLVASIAGAARDADDARRAGSCKTVAAAEP